MDLNRELLTKEIESQLTAISTMENGSEEKAKAIDDICQLYKLELEEKRRDDEKDEAGENRKAAEADRKHERIHRYVMLGLSAVGTVGIFAIEFVGWRWKIQFEETGSVSSRVFDDIGKLVKLLRPGR